MNKKFMYQVGNNKKVTIFMILKLCVPYIMRRTEVLTSNIVHLLVNKRRIMFIFSQFILLRICDKRDRS